MYIPACKKRLLVGAGFSSGLLAIYGPAMAQTPPVSAQTSTPANAASGDIIVTAQRREQRLTEVPVSVQAFNEKTLERAVVTTSADLLKLAPSVNFTQGADPSSSGVAIRGIASVAIEGGGVQPSTALVIDDVPRARQGEFVTDFADVQQIEILRGPQGTLFGKNATAGVINIVENKPTDKYEGSFTGGYTTDSEKLLRGVVNIPLSDTVRLRVNGFWRSQDKLIDNHDSLAQGSIADNPGGSDTYGVSAKLSVDVTPDVNLLLSADASHLKSRLGNLIVLAPDSDPTLAAIQRAAGVVADRDHPFVNSDSGSDAVSTAKGASANVTAHLTDRLSLKSISAYRVYNSDAFADSDGGPWGGARGVGLYPNTAGYPFQYVVEAGGGIPRAPDRSHYYSEEVRLNYTNSRLDVVFGGFAQIYKERKHNTVPFIGDFTGSGIPYYTDNVVDASFSDNAYSAFVDTTYKISRAVSFFGGLRYTRESLHINYQRDDIFTPVFDPITLEPIGGSTLTQFANSETKNNLSGRAGVKFEPSAEHSYYASYSRGYKGPAVDISRSSTEAKAFLKPELANAFEVGTKHQLVDNRVQFNLAFFYQKTRDIQQAALIPGTTQSELQNAGDIEAYGTELEVSGRVSSAFRIDSAFSYVHAVYRKLSNSCYPGQTLSLGCVDGVEDLSGTRANGSPRYAGTVSGNYDIRFPQTVPFDAFFRLAYTYTGSIQYGLNADPLTRQKSHGSLDGTLGLTGRQDRWELLIYGRNLTNKVYYAQLYSSDNFIGRVFGVIPRDFKRYGGLQLKLNF